MPMVEYFDRALGKMAKKKFAYDAAGKEKARKFMKLQQGNAAVGGYKQPKMKSGIKPGTKSPAKSGHTPGVKGTGQTKPGDHHPPKMKKKPEKEIKYVDDDPFEFDKKSTVQYGGPSY